MNNGGNDKYGKTAVLIPCYNEAITIGGVVEDFAESLPGARIFVGDNNSTDGTAEKAAETGLCEIISCPVQGKGAALRTMLRSLAGRGFEAYILVDGDATYNARHAGILLGMISRGVFGMASGDRLSNSYEGQKWTHAAGNRLVDALLNMKYGTDQVKDAMSGLRAFNGQVAEGFMRDSVYDGFEVEVELVMWCLSRDINICSVGCDYAHRPEGSKSKLSTFKDGFRILRAIMTSRKKDRRT